MDLFDIKLWAGTDEALAAYLIALRRIANDPSLAGVLSENDAQAKGLIPGRQAWGGDEPDEKKRMPRLLQVSDGVAVIRIAGALNNSDSWLNQYIGATGYPEIRQALVHAAMDGTVKSIVLDIASGGGAVAGLADTGELITRIDKSLKPITAFSDAAIMSAAYWLGASARSVAISKTAEAGSIGVLIVHQEMTKMMEKAGITPTVIRSGKYKALGNPYEALSDMARAELQASVDHSDRIFIEHVADRRKVSYEVAESKMAQGRVFPGTKALDAGLVDSISNFDAVMAKARAVKHKEKMGGGIANHKSHSQYAANSTQGTSVKTALTDIEIAALAEGAAALEGAAAASADATGTEATGGAPAAGGEGGAAAPAGGAAPAAGAAATTAPAASADVLGFVQGQLATAQGQVLDLTVQLRDAKASNESMVGNHAALRAITVASVDRLRVALGHSAGSAEAMTDTELLAAHSTLRTQFETKFKAGGVAAVSVAATPENKGKAVANDAMRSARINATRLK